MPVIFKPGSEGPQGGTKEGLFDSHPIPGPSERLPFFLHMEFPHSTLTHHTTSTSS